jgi:hypothetical protein
MISTGIQLLVASALMWILGLGVIISGWREYHRGEMSSALGGYSSTLRFVNFWNALLGRPEQSHLTKDQIRTSAVLEMIMGAILSTIGMWELGLAAGVWR